MFPKADPSSFQMYFEAGLNSRDSLSMQSDAANLRAKNRMTIEAYLCGEHEKIRNEDKKVRLAPDQNVTSSTIIF